MSKPNAPRPSHQPQASGNTGKDVKVSKKVQTEKPPIDDVAEMKATIDALTKRVETLGATPGETSELQQIKDTLASLQSRMSSMETFGARGGVVMKEYGGPMIQVRVLAPIRLPRNYALPEGLSRTPSVGTDIELPEELVKEFEVEFKGQFDFSGERYRADDGSDGPVTRRRHKRIWRVVEGQSGPDPVAHPQYDGRVAQNTA